MTIYLCICVYVYLSLLDLWIICRESEYAAWTLVNGYALNHLTVSVHRLSTFDMCNVSGLNQLLQKSGIKLNSDGGTLKGMRTEKVIVL